jgi:hypothetical protein
MIPQAKTELIFTSELPLVISVLDPTGASTGFLPSGLSFNQIKDSAALRRSDGRQIISISEPVAGEYIVILRPVTRGSATVSITTKSEGTTTSNIRRRVNVENRNGWLVHLNVVTQSGSIVDSVITTVEPISDRLLEKVVATELAQERAVPFRLEAGDTADPNSATETDRLSDESTESSATEGDSLIDKPTEGSSSDPTGVNSEVGDNEATSNDTNTSEQNSDEDTSPNRLGRSNETR